MAKKKAEEVIGDWREINFAQNSYNPCKKCGAYKVKMFFKTLKADHFVRSIMLCPECLKK